MLPKIRRTEVRDERFQAGAIKSLHNLTPADVYFGRAKEIETKREKIKRQTFEQRRRHNQLHTYTPTINRDMPKTVS